MRVDAEVEGFGVVKVDDSLGVRSGYGAGTAKRRDADAEALLKPAEDGGPLGRGERGRYGRVGETFSRSLEVVELRDELVDLGNNLGNGGAGSKPIEEGGDRQFHAWGQALLHGVQVSRVAGEGAGGAIDIELQSGEGQFSIPGFGGKAVHRFEEQGNRLEIGDAV